jgi:hypothetical protein
MPPDAAVAAGEAKGELMWLAVLALSSLPLLLLLASSLPLPACCPCGSSAGIMPLVVWWCWAVAGGGAEGDGEEAGRLGGGVAPFFATAVSAPAGAPHRPRPPPPEGEGSGLLLLLMSPSSCC